ncbi:hypothetical protein J3A84_00730 [Proteiniclasticum sp. SCR006]|uniref:Uncharacterized protein n=1 Tax=Proteiniclasticum aestuarii TaxID=2817862 RepID=A0A939KFR9_9CLOT|nr:hypothetical protein [Proteiniclasticum aestuarii]
MYPNNEQKILLAKPSALKKIGDVSWAKFKDQMGYKADWYGKTPYLRYAS